MKKKYQMREKGYPVPNETNIEQDVWEDDEVPCFDEPPQNEYERNQWNSNGFNQSGFRRG